MTGQNTGIDEGEVQVWGVVDLATPYPLCIIEDEEKGMVIIAKT